MEDFNYLWHNIKFQSKKVTVMMNTIVTFIGIYRIDINQMKNYFEVKKMFRTCCLIFLFTLALFQLVTLAQQDLYKYTYRGNREEGRKPIKISAPDLELLSFLGYCEKVDPGTSVELKIKFYLPKDAKFYITAKELRIKEFYLMKPTKNDWLYDWQEFAPWPTKDVLQPLGLTVNDLGILGRVNQDREGSGEIAPLFIYHANLPSDIGKYTFCFISKSDLKEVDYTLYKAERDVIVLKNQIRGPYYGGVPFSLIIDLSQQPEGYYQLVLDCKFKDMIGGPQRSYSFYHKPDFNCMIEKK